MSYCQERKLAGCLNPISPLADKTFRLPGKARNGCFEAKWIGHVFAKERMKASHGQILSNKMPCKRFSNRWQVQGNKPPEGSCGLEKRRERSCHESLSDQSFPFYKIFKNILESASFRISITLGNWTCKKTSCNLRLFYPPRAQRVYGDTLTGQFVLTGLTAGGSDALYLYGDGAKDPEPVTFQIGGVNQSITIS